MAIDVNSEIDGLFRLTVDPEIRLRVLHPDDLEAYFHVQQQNRERLRPWIHPSALPATLKEARIYLIECYFNWMGDPMAAITTPYFNELDHYFQGLYPPLELGIWVKDGFAGVVSLSRLPDTYTAGEFGYWLAEGYEGRGIVTRCVSVLMDFAIRDLLIERFVIGCAVDNQRSRSVAMRLGYRLHAIVPDGEVVGEYTYDRAIYGMRSTEWLERNQKSEPNSSG